MLKRLYGQLVLRPINNRPPPSFLVKLLKLLKSHTDLKQKQDYNDLEKSHLFRHYKRASKEQALPYHKKTENREKNIMRFQLFQLFQ